MRNIILIIFLGLFSLVFQIKLTAQGINVFAGDDITVCAAQPIEILELNATISGLVDDGNWFTQGDGYFLPNETYFEDFDSATYYIPGPNDKISGSVNLILVSEDPDGIGPIVQESDNVTITLRSEMALFCRNNINVSLNTVCQQELLPELLISNAVQPYNLYNIEAFDESGEIVENNILSSKHIGQTITFGVFYECNNNSCWGSLTVEDKFAPTFECTDVTISCLDQYLPEDVGFPISNSASIDTLFNNIYTVSGMDSCGLSYLYYEDVFVNGACASDTLYIINRTWHAEDESGNRSLCVQRILMERIELEEVVFPANFDDMTLPSLECGGNWPSLTTGYPSPDTTGMPNIGHCNYMDIYYTDIPFANCGNTLKVLREWSVIEWCFNQSIDHNQIIKITDHQGPNIVCPLDITVSTSYGYCSSSSFAVAIDTLTDSCNELSIEMAIYDEQNNQISPFSIVNDPNNVVIPRLDLGIYTIVLKAIDTCNNSSECTFKVTVLDQVGPYAVCDEFTVVALISNGTGRLYAESLDDGSFDDCSEVSFLTKKIMDNCQSNTEFKDYVEFCCDELGTTQEVILLVTDSSGNTNECNIYVTIEDDVVPSVTCPPDITVGCSMLIDTSNLDVFGKVVRSGEVRNEIVINDEFNSGVVGYDGIFSDNCNAVFSQSYNVDLECNVGTIIRTFKVTDDFGLETRCDQTITIQNVSPFSESDIIWPDTISFEGCGIDMANIEMMGEPILSDDRCASTAITFDDTVFEFVDGSCSKILRKWTVIDWCQYDSDTQVGTWSHVQVIKQYNTIKPEFVQSNCQDTTVCIIEGCDSFYSYTIQATDDCSSENDLVYYWALDIDKDGIIDDEGVSNIFEKTLTPGNYELAWTVEDGCGNTNACSQLITVVDCKLPSPYCVNSITTVLQEITGEVGIWAYEFNLGSYDNCDNTDDLMFSFDTGQTQDVIIFSCNDIPNGVSQEFVIPLYVTDSAGNQDFCNVNVVIQDNENNVCTDVLSVTTIEGFVKNVNEYVPLDTEVKAYLGGNLITSSIIDNELSPFQLEVDSGETYNIKCQNRKNYDQGVSALDILLIQKHILGIQVFDDPLSIVAADANHSNSVSGIDLAELQKLVLGKIDTLKYNDSWRFIPNDFNSFDEEDFWSFPEETILAADQEQLADIDFTAIKIGDVNNTISSLKSDNIIKNRSNPVALKIENDGAYDKLFLERDNMEGFQFAIKIDEAIVPEIIFADNVEYHYQTGILRVMKVNANGFKGSINEVILSFPHNYTQQIELDNSFDFTSFVIENEQLLAIENIVYNENSIAYNNIDFDVFPNPFSESLHVIFDQQLSDPIEVYVTNVQGKRVFQKSYVDINSIAIRRSDLLVPGIYFLNIKLGTELISKRIILQF